MMKDTQYTVDYFIEKFEKIPDEKWVVGDFGFNGTHCAFGHCGMVNANECTSESKALMSIFGNVSIVRTNDGSIGIGNTPKERILNKLKEIKESTNGN